jgi:hypothetical protein
MLPIGKLFRSGFAAGLLLAGTVASTRGQVPVGGPFFGESGQGLVIITGSVVCAKCSLDEARKAQPNAPHLYQLSYQRNQLVMKMTVVNETARLDSLAWPPQLAVRGPDRLLDRLGAEENLFKEMTIIGLLQSSQTFYVFDIAVKG